MGGENNKKRSASVDVGGNLNKQNKTWDTKNSGKKFLFIFSPLKFFAHICLCKMGKNPRRYPVLQTFLR